MTNAGGIVGYQHIENSSYAKLGTFDCINMGNIEADVAEQTEDYLGGIVGYVNNSTVKRVINLGTVSNRTSNSGLIYGGCNSNEGNGDFIISQISADSGVNANGAKILSQNQMSDVARREENYAGFDISEKGSVWGLEYTRFDADNQNYVHSTPRLRKLLSTQSVALSYRPFNGKGTKESPYLIECQEQFDKFA